MNSELQSVLSYLEKERGLDKEVVIQAVEFALQSASKRSTPNEEDLRIHIDRNTLEVKAFSSRLVVEIGAGPGEIELKDAQKIDGSVEVGGTVELEVTARDFGRIAAQAAKQAMLQKIRQAERDMVFDEYKNRVGDIVSGMVKQFSRSDIVVDLGRAEGILPSRERVPTEEYQVGDRIRAYVLSVQNNATSPAIVLSRAHPDFVRALFRLEVTEIADKIVEIKGVAREPGYRTKIAVVSKDEKVDPVGACVGVRGIRVKNIVRELSGEKIDIVRWSEDVKTYVGNALSPAKLTKVWVDPNARNVIHVLADADQLSLAIGKRGQNVRLTAKLIGWRIDVQKEELEVTFEEKVKRAVESLAAFTTIGRANAEKLVKAGFLTIEGILAAEVKDLVDMVGLTESDAQKVHDTAAATMSQEDGE